MGSLSVAYSDSIVLVLRRCNLPCMRHAFLLSLCSVIILPISISRYPLDACNSTFVFMGISIYQLPVQLNVAYQTAREVVDSGSMGHVGGRSSARRSPVPTVGGKHKERNKYSVGQEKNTGWRTGTGGQSEWETTGRNTGATVTIVRLHTTANRVTRRLSAQQPSR